MSSDAENAAVSNPIAPSPSRIRRDQTGDSGPSKGQQSTRRFVFSNWPDTPERVLCEHALVAPPERTPVSARTGLAVPKWVVVDRREERILICNRIHGGDCRWPWDIQAG
jgi:hypothetical protein